MTPLDPALLSRWRASVGRSEHRRQVLDAESLRRFALATGADPAFENEAPPLAHWAFFLPSPEDHEIGSDGHPRRGGFLPDISLPRRMFAGATMSFSAPLELGETADMISTIASVEHKRGTTGDLVFVDVKRVIRQRSAECVREVQSFVYRDEGSPAKMPEPASDTPEGEPWRPDEANLFRFSAATFNSHRIHYDLPYATGVEGYPALVVHGPFTAAKLAGLAMRLGPLGSFRFRALAPLFLGQTIYLRETGQSSVEAVRCDGQVAMHAEFTQR